MSWLIEGLKKRAYKERAQQAEQQKNKSDNIINSLVHYIYHLENQSFECWTEDAKNGYLTATCSIKEKIRTLVRGEA